ncbi:MAG TPA: serine hydroxymethyltransferase [Candidatus Babeliales bacterium]|nr:serine hydroxymethyltransferase [Candidatus Babeliales bacterium]
MNNLRLTDPAIAHLIKQEEGRIAATINLIASENYPSQAVSEAQASCLTSKYAEGYPGKRYYAGCQIVDQVEQLAIDRCKKMFDAQHANVQPHAGCQANLAVYYALLKPGDILMGMSLSAGGHLTHGHHVNVSGSYYTSIQYGVDPHTELLDYDAIEHMAHEHKPKIIVVGASAYSRIIDYERMATIAHTIGAYLVADIAHIAGLIAAKLHPNPFPHADIVTSTTHKTLRGPRGGIIMCKAELADVIDRAIIPGTQGGPFMHTIAAKAVAFHEALQPEFITYQKQVIANAKAMAQEFINLGYRIVSGGTDNHLFVLDLRNKGISGRDAELLLQENGITVSRSCIPFDPAKPWITSGIRIGTPAMTTRGMTTEKAIEIVHIINDLMVKQPIDKASIKHLTI